MGALSRSVAVYAAMFAAVLMTANPGLQAAGMGSHETYSEDFSISYVVVQYGSNYPAPAYSTDMLLDSNGDYNWNVVSQIGWPENMSASGSVSSVLALSIFESIVGEGFWDMLTEYRDLGTPENVIDTVLTVSRSSGTKTVAFGGYSMMGLMPCSWAWLGNLTDSFFREQTELIDVDVDISIAQGPGPTETDISLSLTNNEDSKVSAAGVSTTTWPVRIIRINGCSVHDFGIRVFPTTVMEFEPGTTTEFEPQTWDWGGVAPGRYVVMVMVVVSECVVLKVTDTSGVANHEPVAEFKANPLEGNKTTKFVFDATRCCDMEDNCTDLKVRWDWDGDGQWDTGWSPERVSSYTYVKDGTYSVAMQVTDTDGLVNETSLKITVTEDNTAFYLVVLGSVLAVTAAAVVAAFVLVRRRNPPKA